MRPKLTFLEHRFLMKITQENSEKAIQYLYGELGGAERDALEERIFTDEEFSLFIESVENDLIDEYARGEMNFADKQRFEEKYLTGERRREKARVATVLHQKVFAEKEAFAPAVSATKAPFWQTFADIFRVPHLAWASGLAAVLLFILIGGWLFLRPTETPEELAKDDNANQPVEFPTPETTPPVSRVNQDETNDNKPKNIPQKSPEAKSSPVKKTPEKPDTISPKPQPRVFAFTLLPPMRSGERPVLNVPKLVETINLRVVHDNQQSFIKYRAEIRDQSGDLIWSREIPVSEKTLLRPINLNVRGGALDSGSYELSLNGITADNQLEEIKFYNFIVRKK